MRPVKQTKAIGNGQVPLVAAVGFELLMEGRGARDEGRLEPRMAQPKGEKQ